jgi:lipopolysaccharide/colanic/teichoic acid biosynthesis glycosyltransferase
MRIDELPQLLNVLKGDMHIVGPRAEWNILVEKYEKLIPDYHMRHNVRPGITGLAQVRYPYGRNILDTKRKLTYDKYYIKNWSIWLEMGVLLQTVGVVLNKKGV